MSMRELQRWKEAHARNAFGTDVSNWQFAQLNTNFMNATLRPPEGQRYKVNDFLPNKLKR